MFSHLKKKKNTRVHTKTKPAKLVFPHERYPVYPLCVCSLLSLEQVNEPIRSLRKTIRSRVRRMPQRAFARIARPLACALHCAELHAKESCVREDTEAESERAERSCCIDGDRETSIVFVSVDTQHRWTPTSFLTCPRENHAQPFFPRPAALRVDGTRSRVFPPFHALVLRRVRIFANNLRSINLIATTVERVRRSGAARDL